MSEKIIDYDDIEKLVEELTQNFEQAKKELINLKVELFLDKGKNTIDLNQKYEQYSEFSALFLNIKKELDLIQLF